MARFIFAYQIRIPLCRSQILCCFQMSVFDFHFIIETNKRQSPFRLTFRIESNERSICIRIFNQLFGIASLRTSGIFNISYVLQLYRHNDDILFIRCFIIAHMNRTFNMRRKIRKFLSKLVRRYYADLGENFSNQVNIVLRIIRASQYRFYFFNNGIHLSCTSRFQIAGKNDLFFSIHLRFLVFTFLEVSWRY